MKYIIKERKVLDNYEVQRTRYAIVLICPDSTPHSRGPHEITAFPHVLDTVEEALKIIERMN